VTIVIALRCADGVIMASDSQGTEASGNVRFPVEKVFQLHSRAVAGGSGAHQVIADIRTDLTSLSTVLETSTDLDQSLMGRIRPILHKHYSAHIDPPNQQPTSPATSILTCGLDGQGNPWIIEIDHSCTCTHYEQRGFHAIGSGAGFAQVANLLMAHFQAKDRPIEHGKLIAYRTVNSVIEASAFGVGGPVQMWTVDAGGVHQLSDDELVAIKDSVGGWEELERAALDEHVQGGAAPGEPAMPPEVRPNSTG
jgi:proteasome beta subunit